MPQVKEITAHFKDRPVVVLGMNTDHDEKDARFVHDKLALNYPTLRAEGLPDLDGEIDYVSPDFVGLRTADGMYRFIHGMGTVALGHHIFQPVDRASTEAAWQAWVDRTFA